MKSRNANIDAAKGAGILLVVLGHAVQHNIAGFDNILFRIIYSFHMPLFMFLSGCVAKYGNSASITKNIYRLVIPFIAWYIVAGLVQWGLTGHPPDVGSYLLGLFKTPDAGLWFLWVLYLCHVVFYLMSQAQKFIGIAGAIVIFLLVQVLPGSILGFSLLKWHFVFFIAGYLFIRYQSSFSKWKYILMVVATISWLLLFPFWEFVDNERFLNAMAHLPGFISNHARLLERVFRYAVAFAGIGMALSVVYLLIPFKKGLALLGLYTLEIYVSHQLLLDLSFGPNTTVKIITCFIDALVLSLLLAFILKKIPYINTLLYGMPLNKESRKK